MCFAHDSALLVIHGDVDAFFRLFSSDLRNHNDCWSIWFNIFSGFNWFIHDYKIFASSFIRYSDRVLFIDVR